MTGLRLYGRYAAASLRSQMQYRASIAMQSLGIFLITGTEFVGIWALFARFGTIRGWTLAEISLFYGLISISWALCDAIARGFDMFHTMIKAGDFDRILLRPRSTVLQLLGQELTLRRVGRLVQGIAVLGYAFSVLDIAWSPAHVVLVVAAIAGSLCVFVGLVVMQATMAFWTTDSLEVWNAFTYGGVTMSQYPLAIYRSWFRDLFTYIVPLGCVNYLPGIALLGREDPLGTPVVVQWLAPLAGPAFLAVALAIWQIGVRHYRSTGS
jgi:ABC-2 type transport system permease protein